MGDVNTPLSSMDRSSRQKSNKETQALNDTLHEMDLIDIYRTFHPKQQNTHSSQGHMEHSLRHILGHKSSLGKLKKIEIISSICSNYKTMILEINNKKKTGKKHKHVEAQQYVTKQQIDR